MAWWVKKCYFCVVSVLCSVLIVLFWCLAVSCSVLQCCEMLFHCCVNNVKKNPVLGNVENCCLSVVYFFFSVMQFCLVLLQCCFSVVRCCSLGLIVPGVHSRP